MKVTGSVTLAAPLSRVWDALQDPAVLARTIPGCRSLEAAGPDVYTMSVSAGVASIKGTYAGRVELADPDPPRSFTLRASGQGGPGTVDATVRVRLSADEADGDATRIDYDADAVIGGMIGGVGQRMLGGVAKKTAGEFFAAVEKDLTGAKAQPVGTTPKLSMPGTPPEPGPPPPPGVRYAGRDGAPPQAVALTGAFAAGGAVALAGVVVGYVLSRRGSAS